MEIVLENPYMLLFLLVIPLIIILHFYFFEHNKKKAMRFANFAALRRVTGTRIITKNTGQLVLRIVTMILLVLAASSPVMWNEADVSSTDYVIAIDSSASMLNEDVLPDRLTVAKQSAAAFLARQTVPMEVGVLSFAGVSFIRTAPTDDLQAAKSALDRIEIDLSGGTDIGSALITSVNMLSNSQRSKSIILITDGSDTSGILADEGVNIALDYVNSNQAKVHTILIGSGSSASAYLEGVNLPAIVNPDALRQISSSTGGKHYEVRSTVDISAALLDIEEENERGKVSFEMSGALFMLAFATLIFEWLLLNTKYRSLP
jgi:Mg-chelatase subunit ChlD